jgi:hypothetical protein
MLDIGILGYVVNPKIGAFTYNLFQYKGVAIVLLVLEMLFFGDMYTLIGIVLFSHLALDRALGYGLKYSDSFKNTHLGKI